MNSCEAVINISKATKQKSRQISIATTLSKLTIEKGGTSKRKLNSNQNKIGNGNLSFDPGAAQPKILSFASLTVTFDSNCR